MPDYDLIVRGGLVAMPRVGMVQADIGVKDGRVRAVGLDLPGSAAETLEAGGLWVFPGLVDPHTHMGNMNPFQEDLATETRSAAFGGVTTIITTLRRGQFTDPLRPYPEFFHQALTSLEGLPSMDWAVHFTTSRSGPPEDYQACYEQLGAQSVKAYLAYKTRAYDPGFGTDDLLRFLQVVATMRHRPLIMVHAEDEDLARVTSEVARAAGLDGIAAWNAARPNFCENVSIHTVCELARHTGVTVYIVHVTTKEGIALIAEEQRRGAPVIAETNVQYLTLTTGMGGVEGKINPPIREQADVDALWRHLEEGTVHTVGSDHVARPASTKEGTIWDASLGFPGAETLLPMLLTGFRQRSLPVERIADLCSLNVARTFGLYPRKGHLSVGADADMVLVDPDQRRVIRAAELHSVARHTPYEGMEAHGWPVATVLRGRVIVKDGQLAGEPSGRFVPVFPGGPGN